MLSDEALPRLAERAGFIVVERPSGQQICDAATAVEGGVVNFVPTHVQPNKILGTTGLQSEQVDGVREWPGIILVTRQLVDGSTTGAVDELTRLLSSPAASDTAPAAANPGQGGPGAPPPYGGGPPPYGRGPPPQQGGQGPEAAAAPAAAAPAAAAPAAAAAAPAEAAKSLPTTGNGWKEYSAPDGRKYYHHPATKTTQWSRPAEMDAVPEPAAEASVAPAATAPAAAAPAAAATTPTEAAKPLPTTGDGWNTPAAVAAAGRGEVPTTQALAGGSGKAKGEVKEDSEAAAASEATSTVPPAAVASAVSPTDELRDAVDRYQERGRDTWAEEEWKTVQQLIERNGGHPAIVQQLLHWHVQAATLTTSVVMKTLLKSREEWLSTGLPDGTYTSSIVRPLGLRFESSVMEIDGEQGGGSARTSDVQAPPLPVEGAGDRAHTAGPKHHGLYQHMQGHGAGRWSQTQTAGGEGWSETRERITRETVVFDRTTYSGHHSWSFVDGRPDAGAKSDISRLKSQLRGLPIQSEFVADALAVLDQHSPEAGERLLQDTLAANLDEMREALTAGPGAVRLFLARIGTDLLSDSAVPSDSGTSTHGVDVLPEHQHSADLLDTVENAIVIYDTRVANRAIEKLMTMSDEVVMTTSQGVVDDMAREEEEDSAVAGQQRLLLDNMMEGDKPVLDAVFVNEAPYNMYNSRGPNGSARVQCFSLAIETRSEVDKDICASALPPHSRIGHFRFVNPERLLPRGAGADGRIDALGVSEVNKSTGRSDKRRAIVAPSAFRDTRKGQWKKSYEECMLGEEAQVVTTPVTLGRVGGPLPTIPLGQQMKLITKGVASSNSGVSVKVRQEWKILVVKELAPVTAQSFAEAFADKVAGGKLMANKLVLGCIAENGERLYHLLSKVECVPDQHMKEEMAAAGALSRKHSWKRDITDCVSKFGSRWMVELHLSGSEGFFLVVYIKICTVGGRREILIIVIRWYTFAGTIGFEVVGIFNVKESYTLSTPSDHEHFRFVNPPNDKTFVYPLNTSMVAELYEEHMQEHNTGTPAQMFPVRLSADQSLGAIDGRCTWYITKYRGTISPAWDPSQHLKPKRDGGKGWQLAR